MQPNVMSKSEPDHKQRERRRFDRQFDYIAQLVPGFQRPLRTIRARGWWIIRLPLAFVFVLGGLLSFLPVLGLWMLPFGLLLLAVDLPLLRGPVSVFLIRARRRINVWVRWFRIRRN